MKTLKIKRSVIVILVLTMAANQLKSQTNFIWGKQFGSDKEEYAMNHVIDNNGNVYIAGKTNGIMNDKNYGKNDGFITKIDSSGNTIWTRQFGSDGEEDIQWSAIDNTGCIYITGSTTGVLNSKNFGREDIFIVKYNPQGEMEWEKQFGTDSTDIGFDNKGNLYHMGLTGANLFGTLIGETDVYLVNLGLDISYLKH